jgi:putative intracellular protease/amidase
VRAFFEAGKPVGAICHAPWTLIDADLPAFNAKIIEEFAEGRHEQLAEATTRSSTS